MLFLQGHAWAHCNINVYNFVTLVNHNRTRCCKNPALMLKVPFVKLVHSEPLTLTARIVPLWNIISKIAAPENFPSFSTVDLNDSYLTLIFHY